VLRVELQVESTFHAWLRSRCFNESFADCVGVIGRNYGFIQFLIDLFVVLVGDSDFERVSRLRRVWIHDVLHGDGEPI